MDEICMHNNIMNHTKELLVNASKQNLQNISLAFRKLLERVTSAQARSTSTSRNIRRGSVSSSHNQQLQRKKKTSVSLFQSRKNSYFFKKISQPVEKTGRMHEGKERSGNQKNSKGLNEGSRKSGRCHSDPSFGNAHSLYSKINQHNQLLITKTYIFDEPTPTSTSKSGQLRSLFRKTAHPKCTHNENGLDINRSQPSCSRQERYQRSKNWKQYGKCKNNYFKVVQLQPWETDKVQQEGFIDH